MTEKPFLISLIDAYSEANDRGSLKTLKESLSNYELTNDDREEIERLIDKGLGSTAKEEIKIESPNHEAKIAEILVTLKTNPDGISDALEEAISPEMREKLADLIRVRMERKGLIESIDWGRNVADYIDRCEKEHGTVMMRTRYATDRFEDKEHPGRFLVLMVCYSRRWSQWFGNCPLSDIEKLERD